MTVQEHRHRLEAILAADAAGYSRLMAVDESATVLALDAARAVFRQRSEACGGRVVDTAGDSVLVVFETAVGAVSAALTIQQQLDAAAAAEPEDRRMQFRIGVHLGDVLEKADGTVYGDGVNIAARLQALAEPGGIVLSDAVRGAVRGKVAAAFDDKGEQVVKNIDEPVRAFALRAASGPSAALQSPQAVEAIDLSLPDKPSIAVLPFVNMSGDPEQDYFTDGLTEDLITELSRFHTLFVIARNSSFTYKGQSPDIRRVGRELGVRYVLEGSIRKSARRIRVTAQLIDALTGSHLWAEKYDRVLEDIFEMQEELTRSIVMAIAPQLEHAEGDRAHRRRPENLGAYEHAVSALAKLWTGYLNGDVELRNAALAEAEIALAIDPRSSLGLQVVASGQLLHVLFGTAPSTRVAWQAGIEAATRAIALDRADSEGYAAKAMLLSFGADKQQAAEDLTNAQRAYELNPNASRSLVALAVSEACTGLADEAIAHLHESLRLNPRDPQRAGTFSMLSMFSVLTGDYRRGAEYAWLGLAEAPSLVHLHGHLAMNLVGLGDVATAKSACAEAHRLAPAWVKHCLAGRVIYRKPEHVHRTVTFLRIAAGLEDPGAADAVR